MRWVFVAEGRGGVNVPDPTCSACGKTIGPRAHANVWQDRVLCSKCLRKAKADAEAIAQLGEPATEPQKDYARALGLDFSTNATFLDLHEILDTHLRRWDPAPAWLVNLATSMGVSYCCQFSSDQALTARVAFALAEIGERDLVTWLVYCAAAKARRWNDDPRTCGVSGDAVAAAVEAVMADPSAARLLRKRVKEQGIDYTNDVMKGNVKTKAWTIATASLRQAVGV